MKHQRGPGGPPDECGLMRVDVKKKSKKTVKKSADKQEKYMRYCYNCHKESKSIYWCTRCGGRGD